MLWSDLRDNFGNQLGRAMSRSLGHHLRLSSSRQRPRAWPSTTRLQAIGQRRHFGISDATGYLLQGSEYLITNVHQLSATPWYVSLPLVAIITSATIRTPLQIWSFNAARRKTRLAPLVAAHASLAGQGLRKKNAPNIVNMVSAMSQKHTKQLFATFGATSNRSVWAALLSLPVFLSNVEVIRRMCGSDRGLLGLLESGNRTKDDEAIKSSESAEGIISAPSDTMESISLEPTFADGGCLWFPNLMEADPYHILPFAVSAAMLLSVLPRNLEGTRRILGLNMTNGQAVVPNQPKWAMRLQRAAVLVALLIGPATMNLPAAIHLYWLSSITTSVMVFRGLPKFMPTQTFAMKPCKGIDTPLLRPKSPTVLKNL